MANNTDEATQLKLNVGLHLLVFVFFCFSWIGNIAATYFLLGFYTFVVALLWMNISFAIAGLSSPKTIIDYRTKPFKIVTQLISICYLLHLNFIGYELFSIIGIVLFLLTMTATIFKKEA